MICKRLIWGLLQNRQFFKFVTRPRVRFKIPTCLIIRQLGFFLLCFCRLFADLFKNSMKKAPKTGFVRGALCIRNIPYWNRCKDSTIFEIRNPRKKVLFRASLASLATRFCPVEQSTKVFFHQVEQLCDFAAIRRLFAFVGFTPETLPLVSINGNQQFQPL